MLDNLINIFNKPEWLLTRSEQMIMVIIFYIILPLIILTIFSLSIYLNIKLEQIRIKQISKKLMKRDEK